MHPLEREITSKIKRQKWIRDDERTIVVAVSGGPDSVALLHLLLPLKMDTGLSLVAAYIDHGLRPAESREEHSFVCSMAERLGISFASEQIQVREQAREEKKSLEHAARDLRYWALRKIAATYRASLIAVGHTADDQAEEVLIRLLRGSGRKGLSGMPDRAGDIIRPLLSIGRNRILAYLDQKKIPFCIDSSNADMRFVRNRVRHSLIPFLEKTFDSGIRKALCKTAESLAEDEKLLEELTANALQKVVKYSQENEGQQGQHILLDRSLFKDLPPSLQRRIVEQLLWNLHCRATYAHIITIMETALHGRTGTEIHLDRGLRVGVRRQYLEFLYPGGMVSWRGRLYER